MRLRPASLDEFVGQEQVLGEGSALRLAIAEDRAGSMILYGPPGSGKTTLARIVAHTTGAQFEELSAVSATVKDVREVLAAARDRLGANGRRTILFLDEIHRFNKAQQDALLPAVEEGLVTLIGATTENPYFEVNSALLSRSQIWELVPLADDERELVVRQRHELPDLRSGEERRVDLEVRVLGRGADQRHEALLDRRQQRVLLRLVEAVDLVEEKDRPAAVRTEAVASGSEHLAHVLDRRRDRRQLLELGARRMRDDPRQRRLAAS